MEKLRIFSESVKGKPWKYRPKLIDQELAEDWSNWIIIPAEGYVELKSYGPIRLTEIEWIEINPIEIKRIGKLMPERTIDHRNEVTLLLTNLNIDFTVQDRIIRLKNGG